MNILIKLMSIVSLVIAPSLAQIAEKKSNAEFTKEIKKEIKAEPVAAIVEKANTVQYK